MKKLFPRIGVPLLLVALLMPVSVFAETFGVESAGDTDYPGYSVYNSAGSQNDTVARVAIDTEGNIYVVGIQNTNTNDIVLQKYDPNGELDTTWGGGDGTVTYSRDGNDGASAVVVDDSGNSYVFGVVVITGEGFNWTVLKYDADGELDTTWGGGDGVFLYNSGGSQNEVLYTGLLADDGGVYAAGYIAGTGSDFAVIKLDSDGELDTTWGGGDGIASYHAGSTQELIYAIAYSSDGGVYAAGLGNTATESYNIFVLKYDVDGELDTTWGGGDGVVEYNSSGTVADAANRLLVDSDDGVYVSGARFANFGVYAQRDAVILKFDANGDLDTTWSDDGVVVYDAGVGGAEDLREMVLVDDEYLYVVGELPSNSGDMLLQRYDLSGDLDTTWGNSGNVTYNGGSGADSASGLALDDNGRLVVAGTVATASNGTDRAILRYTTDGILDVSFGNTPVGAFPQDYILGSLAELTEDAASIDSISIYAADVIGTTTLAIYDESFNLVWESDEIVSDVSEDWLTVSIASGTPATLTDVEAGDYYLAFQIDNDATVPTFERGDGYVGFSLAQSYGAFPDPLEDYIDTNMLWSIYATYTPVPDPEPEVEEETPSSGGGASSKHRRSSGGGSSSDTPAPVITPPTGAAGSVEALMEQLVTLLTQLLQQLLAEQAGQ